MNNKLFSKENEWDIINFNAIRDSRGALISIEELTNCCPFKPKRIYYLYDIQTDAVRGGHSHKKLNQLLIALSGAFKITVENGRRKETLDLRRSDYGLIIRPGVWRTIHDFSYGSVCLCIASELYDEKDYIRDYKKFKSIYK